MRTVDCVIVGGGPAGLTAATYLARFRRSVHVIDNRQSRAALISQSHNYPGEGDGISGAEMLDKLREQAATYGAILREGTVTRIEKTSDGFLVHTQNDTSSARKVILATGIVDEKPNLPRMPEFIYKGAVRFCPICDAYEATDQRIGVIGPLGTAIKKALFLRTYTSDLTVLATDTTDLTPENAVLLKEAGIPRPLPVKDLYLDGDYVAADLADGSILKFDVLYPAMGAYIRSELAINLGADHKDDGCICTSDHHETSIPGFYAIGDISTELHQISVAYGHAAIAATHLHNTLERNFR